MAAEEFTSYSKCLEEFKCSEPTQLFTDEPPSGAVFAPWVKLWIKGGGITYTVGNNSSDSDDNKTVIKSFQYGYSLANGIGAQFEFISEGGESIFNLIDALNKTVNQSTSDTGKTWFRFGWVIKYCDGTTDRIASRKIFLMGKTAKSNYENGFIKINYECIDVGDRIQEQRLQENKYGDAENKISLKEALRKLFNDNTPPLEIQFVKMEKDGVSEDDAWGFFNDLDGRKDSWTTDQKNPLEIARTWIGEERTGDKKGIIIQYEPVEYPILYFIEDPNPGPGEKMSAAGCCGTSVNTYIVNGGNNSPVRSFTPTIEWVLINPGAGGVNPGGDSQDLTIKPEIYDEFDRERELGGVNQTIPRNNSNESRSPNDTGEMAELSDIAHIRAVKNYETKGGIEADLKLTGDPFYSVPIKFVGKTISLIVIDPFHIQGCQWIANPICNPILTNKNWLIKGVEHQISEGNFETTIKLSLAVPNTDIDRLDPLGGEGCGRFVADNIEGEPGQ